MFYTNLFLGLLLILIGILCYKFPNLINPYGGMSPERQALVDIEGLKRGMLWASIATGAAFLLFAVIGTFANIHPKYNSFIAIGLVSLYVIATIVITIRHNGFGRDKDGTSYHHDRGRAANITIIIYTIAASIAFVVVVLAIANKPAKIEVEDGVLQISGTYGRDIPLDNIVAMEVLDEMPEMAMRINGSSFNKKSKGHFLTMDDEECLLFVTYNGGPYLKLRTADQLIYLNRATPEESQQLIQELGASCQKENHGEGEGK